MNDFTKYPKCCERQFLQLNSGGNQASCISCKLKYQESTIYTCPNCGHGSESYISLDLEDDDGNTDWCICESCNHEFRFVNMIVNKVITKVE